VPALLAKVLPGVVSIHTSLATGGQGAGTGMVITSDGEVLTNAHVVSGATTITVTRYGTSRALAARLVGASPEDDLALLHIDSQENLPTVSLGTSADVPVGAFVVAVGNALGLSAGTPSATEGIISAEGRSITNDQDGQAVTLENLFQTDAAINPGNSGGPLFSSDGRVIGINTAVAGAAEGIGFAIPVDQAKDLLAHLRAGVMTGTPLAFLGVEGVSLTPAIADAYGLLASAGVVVFRVVAGSPADAAGLLPDDVVVAIDGAPVNDAIQLRRLVASSKVGQRLQLQIVRGADTTTFTVTLGSAPLGTS
jgi:S1-C subfamily serine protease